MTAANTGAWNFAVTLVDEVPLIATSSALPMPWADMTEQFEKAKGKKSATITVPRDFWIKGRMIAEGSEELTEANMKGRLKASFSSFRQGIEKQRGDLVSWGLMVKPTFAKDGEWTGHVLYIAAQNLDQRKEAIARGKALAASGKNKKKKDAPAATSKKAGPKKADKPAA